MVKLKSLWKTKTITCVGILLCGQVFTAEPGYRQDLDVGMEPVEGAIVLFDGTEHSMQENWKMWPDPDMEMQWKIMPDPVNEGNTMMSCCASGYGKQDLITKQKFTDFEGHVEFIMMGKRGDGENPEGYSNSGVYLQNRYEIQIETLTPPDETDMGKHDIGAITKDIPSPINVWRPQGTWQAFHFQFRAARWDGNEMIEKARVTVWWNGVKNHDDVEVIFAKGGVEVGPSSQGLKLQEHGTDVRFRNIWIKENATVGVKPIDFSKKKHEANLFSFFRINGKKQHIPGLNPSGF